MEQGGEQKTNNKILNDVQTIGWSLVVIDATAYQPAFAYTIGLWTNFMHPELIIFGLGTETMKTVLTIAGDLIKAGKPYEPNVDVTDFFDDGVSQFIPVDTKNIRDYFGYAMWLNGAYFPAMQLVWTDRNNKYPWEEGFEQEFALKQPLLDRNMDLKFHESGTRPVATTKQWLDDHKPIMKVVHNENGEWQFLTAMHGAEDDRIATLGEVVSSDTTLNDLFNLEYGEYAVREGVGEKWVRRKLANEQ